MNGNRLSRSVLFRNVRVLIQHYRPLLDYCVKSLCSIADEERSHLSYIISKADFFPISLHGTGLETPGGPVAIGHQIFISSDSIAGYIPITMRPVSVSYLFIYLFVYERR